MFVPLTLSKEGLAASNKRLTREYRILLNIKDGLLDTCSQPLDSRRKLPVPDAIHQLKFTLNDLPAKELTLIVEREQDALNLQKIAVHSVFGKCHKQKDDHYEVMVTLDGSTPKGSSSDCGR